ncbi:sensor histidine kinase [Wolinella succinogenes]|uniref:histidine kinase n=3 Tax=Wolinella succinogenes TaxID=844 RepID=Q7M9K5_WOLSU|nr:hybrid sensor histidine kinase/response regulator [Wolinella succinogenes]CAE09962.1 TWO-COMPONENT HYBRID SENSOR AND REGULATOR [Wolinella succinogenes]VEG82174.1 Stalked cell differentiation-controlling protein [Wolinella succinogenes]HCZ18170.1 histidine kinase [Helicobacter sp.]
MSAHEATILAVDDTEVNVDILMGILKNYDVIPALSGKEALEIVKNEKIDLILLDIMMPEMDGYEVCRRLKSEEATRSIPIIFITAKTTESDIKEGFERGAVDYVTKPFNPIELISRVDTHLELRSYQLRLEERITQEIQKSRLKDQVLYQQSKQAAIGELLMHIAHQWKQPLSELSSINLNHLSQIVLQEELSKEGLREDFKKTEQILKFMSDTVETFQEFYKPNTQNSFFDVMDAIHQAIGIIDATYHYHKITLTIENEGNPKAYGNPNQYAQAILNLLTNAKDALLHLPAQAPRRVVVHVASREGKSIVSVSDSGGGMSEETLEKLFTPFVSSRQGAGIGLYMSRGIIERLGGSLGAQNSAEGAQFVVTL